jgi:hypothetical protein
MFLQSILHHLSEADLKEKVIPGNPANLSSYVGEQKISGGLNVPCARLQWWVGSSLILAVS